MILQIGWWHDATKVTSSLDWYIFSQSVSKSCLSTKYAKSISLFLSIFKSPSIVSVVIETDTWGWYWWYLQISWGTMEEHNESIVPIVRWPLSSNEGLMASFAHEISSSIFKQCW